MSVRSGDRSLGKITAIDATRILISYTYDRVHDKTLPKSDRWLMAKTIWDDASMARAKLLRKEKAGAVRPGTAQASLISWEANAKRGDTFYQVKRMEAYYKKKARDFDGNESGKTSQN